MINHIARRWLMNLAGYALFLQEQAGGAAGLKPAKEIGIILGRPKFGSERNRAKAAAGDKRRDAIVEARRRGKGKVKIAKDRRGHSRASSPRTDAVCR
jgi:hypothetical protein